MLHYNKENLSLHEPHLFYLFTVQTVRYSKHFKARQTNIQIVHLQDIHAIHIDVSSIKINYYTRT